MHVLGCIVFHHKFLFLVIFQHVASVECQNYGRGNEHANLILTHLHSVLSVDFEPVLIGENYEMPSCHVEYPWVLSLVALSLFVLKTAIIYRLVHCNVDWSRLECRSIDATQCRYRSLLRPVNNSKMIDMLSPFLFLGMF